MSNFWKMASSVRSIADYVFFLLFQPLVLLGLRDEPVGRATAQLFFSSQFYARLAGLLVVKKDFFSTPRRLRDRLAKRGAQLACLFASFCTAQWVGYGLSADVASPLRRTLPLGLALGVVVARSKNICCGMDRLVWTALSVWGAWV